MKYLKETTVEWKEGVVPLHTYIFEGSKCVGYIREGFTEPFFFKTPWKHFDKRKRTFKDVTAEFKKPRKLK